MPSATPHTMATALLTDRRLKGLSEEGIKGVVCASLEGVLTHMSEGMAKCLGGISDCIGNQTFTG